MSTQRSHGLGAGEGRFRSLWSATAVPPPVTERLDGSHTVDVLIIGGGFTGLSTALHLAEAGVSACVLEAEEPGWGASGRNGGQVIPGLKYDPKALIDMYGAERAEPLIDLIGSAADTVFDLIEKYRIDCQPVRKGWIQPAHTPALLGSLHERAAQWRERGAPVELLDRDQMAARLGTQAFAGGWVDLRAGSIHPLNYVRGLVAAATGAGARVYGQARVSSLKRVNDTWEATTERGGRVRARHVVLGTNGYTDRLWPRLSRTVLAANSFIVATRPLSPELDRQILPGLEVASDSRRLLLYFRKDSQGRFVLGGRGPTSDPDSAADWAHLIRSAERLYPALKGLEFEYRWAGRVAITRDFMPHVHEPAPGVTIAMGYNGRGIAMATQLGRAIAQRIAVGKSLPYPVSPIRPVPLHRLRHLYIGLGVAYYGLMDALA